MTILTSSPPPTQVTSLPWNEDEIAKETSFLSQDLAFANSRGVLTINSQPAVNGRPSTDPVFGWGNKGGYVYQKVCISIIIMHLEPVDFDTNTADYII